MNLDKIVTTETIGAIQARVWGLHSSFKRAIAEAEEYNDKLLASHEVLWELLDKAMEDAFDECSYWCLHCVKAKSWWPIEKHNVDCAYRLYKQAQQKAGRSKP